jgi:hypothetical protein
MKSETITLLVETEITFQCEQDRKNAIEYAKHLILSMSGTGVKFEAVKVKPESPLVAYFIEKPHPNIPMPCCEREETRGPGCFVPKE